MISSYSTTCRGILACALDSFGARTQSSLAIRYQAALGDIYYPNTPNRGNCVGLPLNPDGSCTFVGEITPWGSPTTEINRYSAVFGAWFRNQSGLHANINAQIGGADNWVYRTDPTTFFNVTGNVSYAPRPWLMLGGNFIFQQGQNNGGDINFNQHNYVAMANATISPGKHWGLDLAYNFDAIQQNTILCFEGSVVPPGSVPCLGDSTLMQTYAVYQTHTQYGYFALTLTPSGARNHSCWVTTSWTTRATRLRSIRYCRWVRWRQLISHP